MVVVDGFYVCGISPVCLGVFPSFVRVIFPWCSVCCRTCPWELMCCANLDWEVLYFSAICVP
jgi:hypothetical protein